MIVIDADVLGRNRTGEETYLRNLLRELPGVAPDLQFGAVTRRPDLVPAGIEPIPLPARSQELRMGWSLPRLLRRLRPELAHFQHTLPLAYRGRSAVTIHDLHFERDPSVMGIADRLTFRLVVPWAVRHADCVLAVSERTKADAVELYGVPPDRVVVTPLGVDPAFTPGDGSHDGFALFVGAVQSRKDPLAALAAAQEAGLPLVVVGPAKEPALAAELRRRGADVRGIVPQEELAELYRRAAALLLLSRYEGFGMPVLEAMASGTPVVVSDDGALREVAGDAGVYGSLDDALRDRERYRAAGLARATAFSWRRTAEKTVDAYRTVLA